MKATSPRQLAKITAELVSGFRPACCSGRALRTAERRAFACLCFQLLGEDRDSFSAGLNAHRDAELQHSHYLFRRRSRLEYLLNMSPRAGRVHVSE